MNHVRFMISPELHVVQDRNEMQGEALNLKWFRGQRKIVWLKRCSKWRDRLAGKHTEVGR